MDNSPDSQTASSKDKIGFTMLMSVICHSLLVLALWLFVLPPKGRPDATLVSVTFDNGPPASRSQGQNPSQKDTPNPSPVNKEQEVDPEDSITPDPSELLDNLPEDSPELEAYLQSRKRHMAAKKQKIASLAGHQRHIADQMNRRSKYGTLQPRTFYGVKIFARNMVFILDTSGSMDIGEARRQLKNSYQQLSGKEHFSIIAYATSTRVWKKGLVPATEANKKDADKWIDTLRRGGGTNLHGALEDAFKVAWETTRTETMYLVSDGLPTVGKVRDPFKILQNVKNWNRRKKIIIHTIGVGHHQDKIFLQTLSENNYGRYFVR